MAKANVLTINKYSIDRVTPKASKSNAQKSGRGQSNSIQPELREGDVLDAGVGAGVGWTWMNVYTDGAHLLRY